jgi:hypothetical protein
MVQLSATKCSCIAILRVSLVSFAAIILCVASQRVFIVVYFVIDSVRKLLDTPSCIILKFDLSLTSIKRRCLVISSYEMHSGVPEFYSRLRGQLS